MKFLNAAQRARVCRALLTTMYDRDQVDLLWDDLGPTELSGLLLSQTMPSGTMHVPSHNHRVALQLAWNIWGCLPFDFGESLGWPARAWERLEGFVSALADDAASEGEERDLRDCDPEAASETALDAWVRSVETVYGWRKVDRES